MSLLKSAGRGLGLGWAERAGGGDGAGGGGSTGQGVAGGQDRVVEEWQAMLGERLLGQGGCDCQVIKSGLHNSCIQYVWMGEFVMCVCVCVCVGGWVRGCGCTYV